MSDLGGRVGVLEQADFQFDMCRTLEDLTTLERVLESPEAAAQMVCVLGLLVSNDLCIM